LKSDDIIAVSIYDEIQNIGSITEEFLEVKKKMFDTDKSVSDALAISERMGVKAFYIFHDKPLFRFWVYNLTDNRGWWELDKTKYLTWVQKLQKNGTNQ
jgi:hypothetical protein